jgi:hypothetical protein
MCSNLRDSCGAALERGFGDQQWWNCVFIIVNAGVDLHFRKIRFVSASSAREYELQSKHVMASMTAMPFV